MAPQQTIGRYQVLEELGHGAMGNVYRAKDPAMERVVALKTIRPEILSGDQGKEFRERFYREARAAGALAHPGLVPVFDVGEYEGTPFLVMEYVTGRTLADAVKFGGRFSIERACEIGQQIAEALGYAHQKGVVHRDIKAANILLTSKEHYGIERPKVTDFGVAKLDSVQITTTGQMMGTPTFMPPEQFTGGPIDGRTDLFAMGVVLYWLVTGEYPFPGESLTTISYKVMHTEPVPPRKLNPAVPEALDQVILKCLAKNPADRFQSGEELARELASLRKTGMSTMTRSMAATAAGGAETQVTVAPTQRMAASEPPSATTIAVDSAFTRQTQANQAVATTPAKQTNLLVALGIAAVVIVGLGVYALRGRDRGNNAIASAAPAAASTRAAAPPAPAAASATTAAAIPAAAPAAPVAKTAPESASPSNASAAGVNAAPSQPAGSAAAANAPTATARKAATAPAAKSADAAGAVPNSVDFDPLTLDPKENARLRVDLQKLPQDMELILVMDGKLFLRRSATEFAKNNDDMYLPPGVHEFRVRARNKGTLKFSNIVSTDFEAKKHKTLRIELRIPPAERGQTLTPEETESVSRVFVSLR